VKLEIINKESPFYNRNFAVGESFVANDGSKVTINAISQDTIDVTHAHPLVGKTLYFDVEILDIQ
jgi:FKBP-type peptidyl-prolyl cis-trans isomerase 2